MAKYHKSEAQDWAWEALKGQWTTLMTPFKSDGSLDEIALRSNIQYIQRLGAKGAGCTWGMGEFWSLTREERLRVYDVVSEESNGKWLIGAHVTHTSVAEMLLLADHAASTGFDLLIVAASSMVTKTEDQVIEFTKHLADNTDLAIMFYNSPQFGIVMSPQGLQELCQIPNVVGVKEASFNRDLSIEAHQLIGRQAVISTPDEWIFTKAAELGFSQQVMFANTSDWRFDTPGENYYVQFIDMATAGNLDHAFYEAHLSRIKAISDEWWKRTMQSFAGVLPVTMCKYWGELMGLHHGSVRPPLIDLTNSEKAELKSQLKEVRVLATSTRG